MGMRLAHQRAAEQVVGAALVAGHRNIPHGRDSQQGLDVRVVGLGFEGVPEEHQQVDPLFGDLCAELLVAAQGPADHALHRQAEVFGQQQAGGAGGHQVMLGERVLVPFGPVQQEYFAVVMGDQGDALARRHGLFGEADTDHRLLFHAMSVIPAMRLFGVAQGQAVIQHAVGETPFVVVPGQHLEQSTAADLGVVGVEDRRQRVVVEVAGDQGQGVVAEDFRVLAGFLEQGVDLIGGGFALEVQGQVHQRYVDHRYPYGHAGQFACQFRQHQAHRFSGAGLARNHVLGRRARAVRVGVVDVGQILVVGVGVNGGHQAAFDAQLAVQHLGHGRQAVGGAGGVGDDLVRLAQQVVVDAIDHGGIGAFGRGRDDHFAGAGADMRGRLGSVGEQAGAFKHHVDLLGGPGQLGRIADGADGNPVAVDGQAFLIVLHVCIKSAVHGVVFEQVGIDRAVAQVVDGDDLQVLTVALGIKCAQDITADTAKTIDCDS